jgi:DNA-binding response OmpR family regulator
MASNATEPQASDAIPGAHSALAPGHDGHAGGCVSGPPPILIVEDDAGISTMIGLALESVGRSVRIAATLSDALRTADEIRPVLVLLDIRLRGIDGLAFLDAYALRGECRVVVMTASENAVAAAARAGADDSLAKPFGLDELFAIVDRYAPLPGPA